MSITFESTSNSNLVIHNLDLSKHDPVESTDDLIRNRWIHHQASSQLAKTLPGVLCVAGSGIDADEFDTFPTYSGLIGSILTAYNLHQNLQLRPDDVWITILGQFAQYVNGRAEELRSVFVSHEGQMALKVEDFGSVCDAPYGEMTLRFLDEIAANINDSSLREWFLPGFTTTTNTDNIVASATAMCTLQTYFTYTFTILCGIPQVTLLGSIDDWTLLRKKVERLIMFDGEDKLISEHWLPLLRTVLDEFVESARNGSTDNIKFWDSIVQHRGEYIGCGYEMQMNGWLSAFTFFDSNGRKAVSLGEGPWPSISFDSINHNVVTCPVQIDDNGSLYNASLYIGQLAYDYVPQSTAFPDFPLSLQADANRDAVLHTIRPRNDWALAVFRGETETGLQSPWNVRPDGVVKYSGDSLQCPKTLFESRSESGPPLMPTRVSNADHISLCLVWSIMFGISMVSRMFD